MPSTPVVAILVMLLMTLLVQYLVFARELKYWLWIVSPSPRRVWSDSQYQMQGLGRMATIFIGMVLVMSLFIATLLPS